MDWKIFFMVFGSIFLAELGDKTQLATLVFTTQAKSPVVVFAAAALALVLTSLLAVVFGEAISRIVPERAMKLAAGAAFIMIGGLLVIQTLGQGRH